MQLRYCAGIVLLTAAVLEARLHALRFRLVTELRTLAEATHGQRRMPCSSTASTASTASAPNPFKGALLQ